MVRTKSILQDYELEQYCWNCGINRNLQEHHCLNGTANRKLSEKYGLKVLLCERCHREVHLGDGALQKTLRQLAQKTFEREHGHAEYMKVFGVNFL